MKKIYQIFEILTDILEHVRSIDDKCNALVFRPAESNDNSETQIATFLADSPNELQRLFTRVSEFPAPPLALGEIFVVKVYKKSSF